MNPNELLVKKELEKKGFVVKRIDKTNGLPDFLVNNIFYVEVKCLDNYNGSKLSNNQEITFSKLKKHIYIIFVKNNEVCNYELFESLSILPNKMKTINVTFEDKEYKELLKKKNGKSWHDFIMSSTNVRKAY